MESYIAIDNVCAWPNLTPIPDGSGAAVIFNQPTHGRWQGDVECWGSQDEGRTWDREGSVRPCPGADAYYCNRIEAHQRYHMGVVRWRAEE